MSEMTDEDEIEALVKPLWLWAKPNVKAQHVRASLAVSVDWAIDHIPDYVWDLVDIAAQRGLDAHPEWQPIATAPRDGTEVLVSLGGLRTVASQDCEGIWTLCVGGIDLRDDEPPPSPTHWQPLPEPPQVTT